jgi:hypothetical protein
LEVNISDMSATGVNLNLSGVSVSTLESSRGSISGIDLAIQKVASVRGDLGAIQNRLGFTIRSLENAFENVQASESSIRDADVAEEVSAFTRAQILVQANAIPQNALSLLNPTTAGAAANAGVPSTNIGGLFFPKEPQVITGLWLFYIPSNKPRSHCCPLVHPHGHAYDYRRPIPASSDFSKRRFRPTFKSRSGLDADLQIDGRRTRTEVVSRQDRKSRIA